MKVSIIIPCHNAERYLAQTIASVLSQSPAPHEVIVVLDDCTDSSHAIAASFGDSVGCVSVSFGSAARARNVGADLARGDALMFLDADDVLGPGTLAALTEGLEALSSDGIALCSWYRLELTGGDWVKRRPSVPHGPPENDLLSGWLMGWYYPPCSVLWSRGAYVRTGGWDEDVEVNQDGDLMMRALVEGIPAVRVPGGQAFYRRVVEGQSVSGGRFTARGVSSTLRVLRKIALWLEQRQRLDEYRYPLSVALEAVADNCRQAGLEDLESRCEELQLAFGYPRRRRRLYRRAGSARTKLIARLNPARDRSGAPVGQTAGEGAAVDFGLAATASNRASHTRTAVCSPRALSDRPRVSVIVPTYNRAELTLRAVESVLAQTCADFEVLVIDDASTDDTASVIAAMPDPRIRCLGQRANGGVGAARNRGLREARAPFIAFLDSDDEWLPSKLERQLELFAALPSDYGIVGTAAEHVSADGVRVEQPEGRGDLHRDMLMRNRMTLSSVLMRRNLITIAGFFDEHIAAMEDYDYWIRCSHFCKFDWVERPLVRYYDVDETRRSKARTGDIQARDTLLAKHRGALARAGLTQQFLMTSAHRRLSWISPPDRRGAFAVTLRAAACRPASLEPYRLLAQQILPERAKNFIRRFVPQRP